MIFGNVKATLSVINHKQPYICEMSELCKNCSRKVWQPYEPFFGICENCKIQEDLDLFTADVSLAIKLGYKKNNFDARIPLKIQILFNHRWHIYCAITHDNIINLTNKFIEDFTIGYSGFLLYRSKFDNMLMVDTNSLRYKLLSKIKKQALSHNLITFYDLIYKLNQSRSPSVLDFNNLCNEIVKRSR